MVFPDYNLHYLTSSLYFKHNQNQTKPNQSKKQQKNPKPKQNPQKSTKILLRSLFQTPLKTVHPVHEAETLGSAPDLCLDILLTRRQQQSSELRGGEGALSSACQLPKAAAAMVLSAHPHRHTARHPGAQRSPINANIAPNALLLIALR